MDSLGSVVGNHTVFIKSEPSSLLEASDLLKSKNIVLLNLLSLYEDNRCLWDTSSEDYVQRKVREDAWASMFAYYKNVIVNPEETQMRSVIENAKSSWRRELRAVKASMLTGDTVCKPKLWYYDALNFLLEVERDEAALCNDVSASAANFEMENDDEEIIESLTQPMSANDLLKYKNPVLIKLFSLFEQNRCLWDTSNEDYSNRKLREDAWATLYTYYRKVIINPERSRMRSILSNARTSWRREFRAVQASMVTGDSLYHPKLWYYDALNFLAPVTVDGSVEGTDLIDSDHTYLAKPPARKDSWSCEKRGPPIRCKRTSPPNPSNRSVSPADVVMDPLESDDENPESFPGHPMSVNDLLKNKSPVLMKLFSLYRRHRCLWDPRDENYSNRDFRQHSWASLYEYYKKVVGNPDEKRMRSLFNNAKTCWRREFKAVKASMLTGDGDTVHQPKLWYYDALSFLATADRKNETDTASDRSVSPADVVMNPLESDDENPESFPGHPMSVNDLLKNKSPVLMKLFSLYRRHRCLWDPRDENYSNRDFRQHSWASLYEYYKKVVGNPDEKRMRSLFNNAKTCWRREFKAVKASMLTGDGDTVHQPKLWYYDALSFLAAADRKNETDTASDVTGLERPARSVKRPERYSDTYSLLVVDEDGTDMNNDLSDSEVLFDETPDPLQRQPKKRKMDLSVQAKAAMIEAAQRLISSEVVEDDMWVTQGKAWGQRLATMDGQQRAIAMKLIGDVLFYADMKMLTRADVFSPGTSL